MKRKEDAEQRKQEEEQQRQIAQQGHWRLGTQAPISGQQPKFRVEYDGGLGTGPTQTTASAARHTFGKFISCTIEGTERAMQVDDHDAGADARDDNKGTLERSTFLQKRPRE